MVSEAPLSLGVKAKIKSAAAGALQKKTDLLVVSFNMNIEGRTRNLLMDSI